MCVSSAASHVDGRAHGIMAEIVCFGLFAVANPRLICRRHSLEKRSRLLDTSSMCARLRDQSEMAVCIACSAYWA